MVSYERLWKTMEKKGISQYRLINHYKISAGQIGRMKKNMHVSTHTLEVFCNILQCPVEDIVEVILDPQELDGKEPSSAGSRTAGRTAAGARDAKKAEGVTGDKAPGKPESRSGVQGTVKPAAASSSESSPKPAVASIAHGCSAPFMRAAFTNSSCCRRPCLSRGSMRPKSARSSIVPSASVRPSGFPVSSSPAARATEKGSTTPMSTP